MSLPSAGPVDSFEALARSPMLSRLRGLVVNYGTEDAAGTSLGVVIDSPKAAGLVELEIHGSSDAIVADLVRRFTRANHLTNLRKLKFTNPPPNPSWVADFLASAQLAGVVDLDLGALDEAGLHALIASPHLSGLRRLRLWPWTVENVSPSTLARLEKRFPGVVKVM
jgi:hypothetical protein